MVNLMTGMIAQLLAWPTLGVALLVFGFAPGVALRLIVLFYPHNNPRRRELRGELYAVPRIERPFWVAEQLEVALFEGLRDRRRVWRDRRTRRTGVPNTADLFAETDEIIARLDRHDRDVELGLEELERMGLYGQERVKVQLAASDDPLASLLADDVARGWRGRGWRGAEPEVPPRNQDPHAGV
jgi:hypothetical protein